MKNGFRVVKGGLRKRKPLSFIYRLFVSYHPDFPLFYSIEEHFVGIPCDNMLRPLGLFIADNLCRESGSTLISLAAIMSPSSGLLGRSASTRTSCTRSCVVYWTGRLKRAY